MDICEYRNCCGHFVLSELEDVNPRTGKIEEVCLYTHKSEKTLKTRLGQHAADKSFSWIGTQHQLNSARALRREFEKLGFKVTVVQLGKNPSTGNDLTMWVAVKNKKKKASAKKALPTRLRLQGVPK